MSGLRLLFIAQWVALLSGLAGWHGARAAAYDADLGMIVVSPNGPQDGAPFGPGTAGTATAGIQEALNQAEAENRSVCIRRGTYELQATVTVGPMQGRHLEAGHALLRYTPANVGPVVVVDSQLDAKLDLPTLEAPSLVDEGCLLQFRPVHAIDGAIRIENCDVRVGQVSGRQSGDGQRLCTGIQLDSALGEIVANRFSFSGISGARVGIHLQGAQSLRQNLLECFHLRNNHTGILVESGSFNRMQLNSAAPALEPSIGLLATGGSDNLFQLATTAGGHQPNGDFKLMQSVARSRVIMPQLWNGYIILGTQNKLQIQDAY